jgi:hypothetical protein
MTTPESLAQLDRYAASQLQWGQRDEELVPCAIQPRDVEILAALWRYHFLTTTQVAALWWPDSPVQVPRRRLVRLFRAGLVERFRPYAQTGSFHWTYTVSRDGYRLAYDSGALPRSARFTARAVYDYRFALHDLRLNAWVLAYRELAGERLLAWHGEEEALIEPPTEAGKPNAPLGAHGRANGLKQPRPNTLYPDAAVEAVVSVEAGYTTLLLEYDRTQRPEKNYPKFRRYDSFLCDWWQHTDYADQPSSPHVVFVCQNDRHLRRFLEGADHQVTGYQARAGGSDFIYPGRRRMLFVTEEDAHRGDPRAWRLPPLPAGHRDRGRDPLEPEQLQLPAGPLAPTGEMAA